MQGMVKDLMRRASNPLWQSCSKLVVLYVLRQNVGWHQNLTVTPNVPLVADDWWKLILDSRNVWTQESMTFAAKCTTQQLYMRPAWGFQIGNWFLGKQFRNAPVLTVLWDSFVSSDAKLFFKEFACEVYIMLGETPVKDNCPPGGPTEDHLTRYNSFFRNHLHQAKFLRVGTKDQRIQTQRALDSWENTPER